MTAGPLRVAMVARALADDRAGPAHMSEIDDVSPLHRVWSLSAVGRSPTSIHAIECARGGAVPDRCTCGLRARNRGLDDLIVTFLDTRPGRPES